MRDGRGGIRGLVRLIRDHGEAVEADLAYQGIDIRDLGRTGSGMTLRRLAVLVRALPAEATIWPIVEAEQKKALRPTPEQIRARQAHYDRLREGGD